MNRISQFSFKGRRAVVRVDFNVPLNEHKHVTDSTRIEASLKTLKHILNDGGSAVVLSHFGRPKSGPDPAYSLRHVLPTVQQLLGVPVHFVGDCIGAEAETASKNLKAGEVLLLENVRFYAEETKGERGFAESLSRHGDVYVNDAFGAAHRAHASTTTIAEFFTDKLFGYLMEAEIENATRVMNAAEKPFLAIVGGAKVSSKIEVLSNLLPRIDALMLGGGMAYTFVKARGGTVGKSLVEDDYLDTARAVLKEAEQRGVKVYLPADSIVASAFAPDASTATAASEAIGADWMALDIGAKATADFCQVVMQSATILWNGPLGVFEMEAFSAGTKAVAQAIADATARGAFSLVGGGDSVAAAKQFGMAKHFSYVSTGGGAMLEFLEGKTLPGVKAIAG